MRSVMKIVLVKALLFLITTSAAAVTSNQEAFTNFTDANGNPGFVYVTRVRDPQTAITTTTLTYSFCAGSATASCQEGNGVIPNGDFTGTLDGNVFRPEKLKLLADTTVAGFNNVLCVPGGDCSTPATGGLINIVFTTITKSVEVWTVNHYQLVSSKVTANSTDVTSQGAASVQGTVFGINATDNDAIWVVETANGKGSPGSKLKNAKRQLSLEKSLNPTVERRVQRLRGEQPSN